MKKLILLAGAVGLLVAAPTAPAKTVTVDISKAGFVPAPVTVQAGDTVTWTNKDTANHQVVCATCPFTSPVLRAGPDVHVHVHQGRQVHHRRSAEQEQEGDGHRHGGTGELTVAAAPRALNYGPDDGLRHALDCSGESEGRHPGSAVRRERREGRRDRDDRRRAARSRTTAKPTLNTSYQARFSGGAQRGHEPRGQCLGPPDREVEADRAAQVHRAGHGGSVVRRQGRHLPALGRANAPLDRR